MGGYFVALNLNISSQIGFRLHRGDDHLHRGKQWKRQCSDPSPLLASSLGNDAIDMVSDVVVFQE